MEDAFEGVPPQRTAAGRVLALIGAFEDSDGPLTLSEISRRSGLAMSTAHRLVREVLDWGGLDVEEGGYRLSTKFLNLASSSTRGLRLRDRALPQLMDLHRQVGGTTVHLAVRQGDRVMYLDALRSYPNYTGESRIGGTLPLHASAAGLVLLAHAPHDDVEEYLSRPLQRFTSRTIAEPVLVREAIDVIRTQGHCVYPQSIAMDAGGVAAPIVNPDTSVDAVVNVVWLLEHQDPQKLVSLVRAAASRISNTMAGARLPLDRRTIEFNRRRAGLAR